MSIFRKISSIFSKKEEKTQTGISFSPQDITPFGDGDTKPGKTGRIVVFEDSETWAAMLKKSLEEKGYRVYVFNKAINAIDHIKRHKPDLVLMDVNLPGMSGYEATKMIKSRHENRELPVIILTSYNTPKDRLNAMKVGARTFLTKDQPLEDLIYAISTYMTNTAFKSDISQLIKIHKKTKN